jgi:alkylation response protein AidB-like acyl-CoA dehydrogenase
MSDILDLSELREAIRGVLADRSGGMIEIPGDEGCGIDRALWREMAELGWLALAVPEEHGGLAMGLEHLAVLYEELGRQLAAVPILPTMMVAAAIARHGDNDIRSRWLPAIASGECVAAIALPGEADLPVLDVHMRLNGVVDDVSFADVADLLLVPVCVPGGTSLALVPRGAAGVAVEARPLVDLTRSMGRITFTDVALEPAALLRLEDADWSELQDHAAFGLACDAVGGASEIFERTIDYLKIREQFGRPIGSFQALKHCAADWKVRLEASISLTRHSAAVLEVGEADASATASGAKAYACDVFAALAADAIQLHGGIGFTWEHPCHLFLKRAKLSQQLFGSSTQHKERVARLAFKGADLSAVSAWRTLRR